MDPEKNEELLKSPEARNRASTSASPTANCEIKLKILRREYKKLQHEFESIQQNLESPECADKSTSTPTVSLMSACVQAGPICNSVASQTTRAYSDHQPSDLTNQIELLQRDRAMIKSEFNTCQSENEKMKMRLHDTERVLAEMSEKLQNVSIELYESQQLGARTRPIEFEQSDRQFCGHYGLPESEFPISHFECYYEEKSTKGVFVITPNYFAFGETVYPADTGGVLGKIAAIGDIIKGKNNSVWPWALAQKVKSRKFRGENKEMRLGLEILLSTGKALVFRGFGDRDLVVNSIESFIKKFAIIRL